MDQALRNGANSDHAKLARTARSFNPPNAFRGAHELFVPRGSGFGRIRTSVAPVRSLSLTHLPLPGSTATHASLDAHELFASSNSGFGRIRTARTSLRSSSGPRIHRTLSAALTSCSCREAVGSDGFEPQSLPSVRSRSLTSRSLVRPPLTPRSTLTSCSRPATVGSGGFEPRGLRSARPLGRESAERFPRRSRVVRAARQWVRADSNRSQTCSHPLRATGRVEPPSHIAAAHGSFAAASGFGRIRTTDLGLVKAAS